MVIGLADGTDPLDRTHLASDATTTVHDYLKKIAKRIARPTVRAALGEVRWTDFQLRRGNMDYDYYYNRMTELIFGRVLTPTSICIDVGCHVGKILREMIRRAPNGHFLAFEPLPDLFQLLTETFQLPNLQLYNLALSDTTGQATFNWVTNAPALSGMKPRIYTVPNASTKQIRVRTDTLDNVLEASGIRPVALIKIDVEGGEYHVLRGAVRCITRDKPFIIFEHGLDAADCYGHGPEVVYDLFKECGMAVSLMSDFLRNKQSLGRDQFRDQYYARKNYYFIAHNATV